MTSEKGWAKEEEEGQSSFLTSDNFSGMGDLCEL